jgi:hypothetical protein
MTTTDPIKQAFNEYYDHQAKILAEEVARCRTLLRNYSDDELRMISQTLSQFMELPKSPVEQKAIHLSLKILGVQNVAVTAIVMLEEIYRRSEQPQAPETSNAAG